MPNFEWTEQHCVFVPEIDDEHRLIFKLCGNLQGAISARAPRAQVHRLVTELAVQSLEHFWHEEREMRAEGYTFYTWHKQQHRTARTHMIAFEGRVSKGDREAARELLVFLHGWLNNHVKLTDRMLGGFLRNRRRELSAKAS